MTLAAPKPVLATFSRRAAAYLLDVLIAGVGLQLVQWSFFFALGDPRGRLAGGWSWFAYLWLTASAPVYAYFALSESSSRRASPGKQALGLYVGDVYGVRISLPAALMRTFLKLAPWDLFHAVMCFPSPMWDGGPPFEERRGIFAVYALMGVNLAVTLITRKQQSVHDLAAGTLVLRSAKDAGARGAPPTERA